MSLGVLRERRSFLAIFPQGKQVPAHLPLEFQKGVLWLSRRTTAPLLPVAIRYDFLQGEKPVIHVSIGPVLESSGEKSLLDCESAVERELRIINQGIVGSLPAIRRFEQVLDGGGDRVPSQGARALLLIGGPR